MPPNGNLEENFFIKASFGNRKKMLIVAIAVVLLLLSVAGFFGIQYYKIYSLDKLVRQIETFNQQKYALYSNINQAANVYAENWKLIWDLVGDQGNDKTENNAELAFLSQEIKGAPVKLRISNAELLNIIKEESALVSEFKGFLLNEREKEFLNKLRESIDKERDAADKYQEAVSEDMEKVVNGLLTLLTDIKRIKDLSHFFADIDDPFKFDEIKGKFDELYSLQKYTREDFKLEGEDIIKEVFPDDIYQALILRKKFLGSSFQALTASVNRDYQKLVSAQKEFEKVVSEMKPFNIDLTELSGAAYKEREILVLESKKIYVNAFSLYAEEILPTYKLFSKESSPIGRNRNTALAIKSALSLYAYDHENKYPITKDFEEVSSLLRKENYLNLEGFRISPSDFTYFSSATAQGKWYKLTFREEASDKIEVLLEGRRGTAIEEEKGGRYLRLISPNGGENPCLGENFVIQWEGGGLRTVSIYVKIAGELTPIYHVETLPADFSETGIAGTGNFVWKVGEIKGGVKLKEGYAYEIMIRGTSIEDSSITDISDKVFSILNCKG